MEVTPKIIEEAVARDSGHCMIAEAIKTQYPQFKSVSVDLQTIRFSDPDKRLRYVYLTPRPAQIALVEFDQGIKPVPLKFRLARGQVTAMARPQSPEKAAEYSKRRKEREKRIEENRKALSKAEIYEPSLVVNDIPEVIGGKAPPGAALSGGSKRGVPRGRRRAFGLRALDKIK